MCPMGEVKYLVELELGRKDYTWVTLTPVSIQNLTSVQELDYSGVILRLSTGYPSISTQSWLWGWVNLSKLPYWDYEALLHACELS